MRWSSAILSALLGLMPLRAQQPEVDDRVRIELTTERLRCLAGQPVDLVLRIGVESGFLRDNLIQLFQRRLDVPMQVRTPWRELPPDLRPVDARGAVDERTASLVVDDQVVAAARLPATIVDGRRFEFFEVRRRVVASAAVALELAAPAATFAFATRFEDDFINGRMPIDRRDGTATGAPLRLRFEALPTDGCPDGFGGAIGRFSIDARVEPPELELGASLQLTLRIVGDRDGNLALCDAPRLDALTGFHVLGQLDDRGGEVRTVTAELVPLRSDVTEVPAIPFAFFDPGPDGGYRVATTEPIPIRVVGPTAPAAGREPSTTPEPMPAEPVVVPGRTDIYELRVGAALADGGPARPPVPALWAVAAGLVVPWGLALVWFLSARARGRRARTRVGAHARAEYRRRRRNGDGSAFAFAGFLADWLDCAPAAVIAPSLRARLQAAGLSDSLAMRAAAALEQLTAARYRGPFVAHGTARADELAARLADDPVDDLVADLDAAFRALRGPR